MQEKISAVYKIVNTVTGDFYIGSSRNVKERWVRHKRPSRWKEYPNSKMYQDFQKYGIDKFRFQILAPVMPEYLKQVEQEFIDMLKPTYNDRRANGFDRKESNRKYCQSEKGKKHRKDYMKEYHQSEKGKEVCRRASKKYKHQLCLYNGETLTFNALSMRFKRAGIPNPNIEAKKYLIK